MGFKQRFGRKKVSFNRNRAEDQTEGQEIIRVRMPRPGEVIGLLEQRLGGSRVRARCMDGKTRICRIPGALKKHLWVREGDVLLIKPWEFSGEDRGDIIFKYRANQVEILRQKGLLKDLGEFEEF